MLPLTKQQEKRCKNAKLCHICPPPKKIREKVNEDKNYRKVRDHCHYTREYRGAAHSTCNLRYKTTKEIPVVFDNGSNYEKQFTTKELAEEFEGQFECLEENTEKYITFSVSIRKRN